MQTIPNRSRGPYFCRRFVGARSRLYSLQISQNSFIDFIFLSVDLHSNLFLGARFCICRNFQMFAAYQLVLKNIWIVLIIQFLPIFSKYCKNYVRLSLSASRSLITLKENPTPELKIVTKPWGKQS